MKTRRLITTKPHKYGTRYLTAGDEYEAPIKHAFALVAGRRARFAPDKPPALVIDASGAKAPAPEPERAHFAEPEGIDAVDRLRQRATELGIDVDGRWGVARLQYEISKAQR